MPLTEQQIEEVKEQLRQQIEHLSPEKKEEAEKQIEEMSPEAIEAMLKQSQSKSKSSQKDVFRMIVDKEIPSKIIDENKEAIAVLDIKPISPGHSVIIPKKAVKNPKEMPNNAFSLAKKIAKKISSKLKAISAEIQTEFKFGETIINIIPIYDKPLSLSSPRKEVEEKELDVLYQKLRTIKKEKVIRIKKESNSSNLLKINRRIP